MRFLKTSTAAANASSRSTGTQQSPGSRPMSNYQPADLDQEKTGRSGAECKESRSAMTANDSRSVSELFGDSPPILEVGAQ